MCQWAGMCSGRLGLHPKSDQGPTSWSGTFDGGKGKGICVRVVHWQSSAPAWRWQAQFSPVLGWPESITWPNSNTRDRGKCNCPEDGRRARHTVNSLSVLSVAGHCETVFVKHNVWEMAQSACTTHVGSSFNSVDIYSTGF